MISLLILDLENDGEHLGEQLKLLKFHPLVASSLSEAIEVARSFKVSAAIADLEVISGNAFQYMEQIQAGAGYTFPHFFVSKSKDHSQQEIMQLGGQGLFIKPVDIKKLATAIHDCLSALAQSESKSEPVLNPGDFQGIQMTLGLTGLEALLPDSRQLTDLKMVRYSKDLLVLDMPDLKTQPGMPLSLTAEIQAEGTKTELKLQCQAQAAQKCEGGRMLLAVSLDGTDAGTLNQLEQLFGKRQTEVSGFIKKARGN